MRGGENGDVWVSLDHFNVCDSHIFIFRYKQPSPSVTQLDNIRIFDALRPLANKVHVHRKVGREFLHSKASASQGRGTFAVTEAVV